MLFGSIVVSQARLRDGRPRVGSGPRGVREPLDGVVPYDAIAFLDIRPGSVRSEPQKQTRSTLVCALGQYDLITRAAVSYTHLTLPTSDLV